MQLQVETAIYKDGAIGNDIDEAKKTATSYITNIDDNGISVHPVGNNNDRIQINSNGTEIYQGNESVAQYGETARIGKENGSRFLINSDSLQAYSGTDTQPYFEVSSSGLSYGSYTAASTADIQNTKDYAKQYTDTAKTDIKITTDGISSEVSKKVGNDEIISKINQSPETVIIDASRVEINGAAVFASVTNEVVKDVIIEYGVGQSSDSHADIDEAEGWSSETPEWVEGSYVWQRTTKQQYVYNVDTEIYELKPIITYACIQGAAGEAGIGTTIVSIQYSTDNIQWQNEEPSVNKGDWLYIKTTYSDGTYVTTKSYMGTDGQDGHSVTITSSTKIDDVTTVTFSDGSVVRIEDGVDGNDGIPGEPGVDGKTSYTHFAWANSSDGQTDFSTSISTNKKYIGVYSNFAELDSQNPGDYSWTLTKGEKGEDGTIIDAIEYSVDGTTWEKTEPTLHKGDWLYVKTIYSDGSEAISKSYIGTDGEDGHSITIVSSTKDNGITTVTFSDGSVVRIEDGEDGANGTPGTNGTDGKTYYTHFAWTNTLAPDWTGFDTVNSNNKLYIGVYSDENQLDSSDPTKYSWTLIKGEKGENGISPTFTTSYDEANGITTITITDANGQRQVQIRDGGEGAEWFFGTDVTHTSGDQPQAVTGAKVGSMYLNTDTSNVYKCRSMSGDTPVWTYIMCLAADNTIKKVVPIYTRTNSATPPTNTQLPSVDNNKIITKTDDTGRIIPQSNGNGWTLMHESRIAPPPSGTTETTAEIRERLQWKYLWTCNQLINTNDELIGHTAIVADEGTTVIDGADITTGTITAEQIAAHTITANEITADNIISSNGNSYINLANGTFEYKDTDSWSTANSGIKWNGSNLNVKGAIYATSLTLGPNASITAGDVSGLSTVATTGSYNDLTNKPTIPSLTGYIYQNGTIGTTPTEGATGFVVSNTGLLQASNAVIYGSLYASKGYIGGWQIGTDGNKSLHNGNVNTSPIPGEGVIILSKGITGPSTATGVLPANQNWTITAGNQFGVTTDGTLYAANAKISGTITIGGIGSNIYTADEINNNIKAIKDELYGITTYEYISEGVTYVVYSETDEDGNTIYYYTINSGTEDAPIEERYEVNEADLVHNEDNTLKEVIKGAIAEQFEALDIETENLNSKYNELSNKEDLSLISKGYASISNDTLTLFKQNSEGKIVSALELTSVGIDLKAEGALVATMRNDNGIGIMRATNMEQTFVKMIQADGTELFQWIAQSNGHLSLKKM